MCVFRCLSFLKLKLIDIAKAFYLINRQTTLFLNEMESTTDSITTENYEQKLNSNKIHIYSDHNFVAKSQNIHRDRERESVGTQHNNNLIILEISYLKRISCQF